MGSRICWIIGLSRPSTATTGTTMSRMRTIRQTLPAARFAPGWQPRQGRTAAKPRKIAISAAESEKKQISA
jgi:hypothetical protein